MHDGPASLALFAHLASRPEREIDLARVALLIAEPEVPGLDVARYVERLDRMGDAVRDRPGEPKVAPVVRYLYEELGFRGNTDDYYDPRNSFLHDVIDRRCGIPITLALVLLETCRRAGIEAHGISFPGHFLVRVEDAEGFLVIDPYDGRLLDRHGLRQLYERVGGGQAGDPPAALLRPASKAQIVLRLLNNLRGIYEATGDAARQRQVLERMQVVAPSDDVRHRLEALSGRLPPGSGRPNRTLN